MCGWHLKKKKCVWLAIATDHILMHSYIVSDPYCLLYFGLLFLCLVYMLVVRLLEEKKKKKSWKKKC